MAYDLWHRRKISQSFARGDGSTSLNARTILAAGTTLLLPYLAREIDIRSHRQKLRDLSRTTLELPAMPMSELVYGKEKTS